MIQPLVAVQDLSKDYQDRRTGGKVAAVSRVSFAIESGETLGVVGESGSGKTTVGRCLLKFIEPSHGKIHFDGHDITAMDEGAFRKLRPRIQMVFQEPHLSLNPRMKVFETIAEPLRIHGALGARAIRDRVHGLIGEVHLEEGHLQRYPHQLSSGQQQRVGIARAIATNPSFLVLDEPTSALDPSIRGEIVDLLLALQREHAMTYLYISHDLGAIRYVCDRVAVMYRGSFVEMGTAEQIFGNALHPYTRALLSAALVPDPKLKRARYTLRHDATASPAEQRGCPLYDRCPEARALCRDMSQPLTDIGDGHLVACWRVRDRELWSDPAGAALPPSDGGTARTDGAGDGSARVAQM